MIRKDKHYFADGSFKTQIRVTEGYRVPGCKNPKQRTIKSFGYLEDQPDQEAFLQMVRKFDKEYKANKKIIVEKRQSEKPFYESEDSISYNFGYRYLEAIYNELELDKFFGNIEYHGEHSLNSILKYLTIQRILSPDSKRATFQNQNLYGMNDKLKLPEIYRSLTYFDEHSVEIQKHLNEIVKKKIGRNTDEVFYDVTNYYFTKDFEDEDIYEEVIPMLDDPKKIREQKIVEIEEEDGKHQYRPIPGLAKKGVSKEHQLTPIVQMGLFMDDRGLPINMQLFPGNTSDSLTLLPLMGKIKESYNLNRIVVVADKGMNSSKNINKIIENGDGYVFSQIVRGKKGKRYHDRLFDDELYTVINEDYKYQLFTETYKVKKEDGSTETRERKVLLYYNGKEARRTKRKRDDKVKKALKSLENAAYTIDHSKDKYCRLIHSVKETGEIAEQTEAVIDEEKIREEEKYDGYFCIITSEMDWDEKKIREVYHGLWRIEETFRITKSDLEARPIYVRTKEHIGGHFLICFIALLMVRILQDKMNYKLSAERIARAFNMCGCSMPDKGVVAVQRVNGNLEFEKKKSKNGKEYNTLRTNNQDEVVNDFISIISHYSSEPVVSSFTSKKVFDSYLNSIKLKLK
ncbi:MAG: IS1634 family transposase [Erysipelotrichaceae bacterium]|uniref:IS1634 family transposase n=1 Tax=Floccifex sp. TaxID=2815810 RepID=UPI002A748EAE|nr:IS1634 family transposase [Floccifex sp.]MDD7281310.1 IS1634 family transposase [Erysipelotrichaceae bacterium]MDY2958865.1 IS1634 family transposase [Floccifex sp.]